MSIFFKVCVPRSGKGEGYEMANGCGCLLAKQNGGVLSHSLTYTQYLCYNNKILEAPIHMMHFRTVDMPVTMCLGQC